MDLDIQCVAVVPLDTNTYDYLSIKSILVNYISGF